MTHLFKPPALPVLSVRNLCVSFGRHQAVRGLSFDVNAGETLALVGESGSGKSATALSVLRLIEHEGGTITSGTIRLGGNEPATLTDLDERALQRVRGNRISMVFQEPMTSLNPVMRIGKQLVETIKHHQNLGHKEAYAMAGAALERVRIPDPGHRLTQYAHELSGGLRQRVMIAIALACRPELLIADEPTTALDVTTQAEILALIQSLQAELGMAVLFITHDMGVVAEMADRVVVMRQGEMVEQAPLKVLFANPKAPYSRTLMAATPKLGSGAPMPLEAAKPVLQVHNLCTDFIRRGGFLQKNTKTRAVNNVSLTLFKGETLGLVGESGCGKSSLARSILRLIEPTSGQILLNGTDITMLDDAALRQRRANMQMVFQDPFASLNPRLPVLDLITEPAYIHGLLRRPARRERAVELLEQVGLDADAVELYPHQFSGGQRQRICIARALSLSPQIIVADEAVSALDVSSALRITTLMSTLQANLGVSFLFISHDIAVIERVSHRIAVMYRGEIVETGPTNQILSNPRHDYTQRLLASVPVPDPTHKSGSSRHCDPGLQGDTDLEGDTGLVTQPAA